MRMHSDFIEDLDVRKAARAAGVDFTRFDLKGSRTRDHAFDVILTGSSSRRQNGGSDYAATWDEWGVFLGTLFALDPRMVTTPYESGAHFDWSTGGQYRDGASPDRHKNHKWEWFGSSATGNYHAHECQCGAIRRFLAHNGFKTFAEFEAAHA
jgi:hypothetical protein